MSDSEENPKDLASEEKSMEENGSPSTQPDSGGGGDAAENKPSSSPPPPASTQPGAAGDGEAEEEEEPKPGLLEQPIVIEGKRQRKKVERLSEKISEIQEIESKAKEIVIAEGKGVKLGSIPYVQYQLNKNKPDDLKLFHRVLFGKVAPNKEVKKNIVQFSGYGFNKDSKEFEKKHEMVSRVFMAPMKEMLEILGLEKSGHKEELVARMLAYLLKPHDTEKKVPEPKKKRQRKGKGKKGKSGGEKKASAKASSAADNNQVSSGSDIESDSDSDAANTSDSSAAKKKEPPKKKAKVEKKTEKKAAPPKKKAAPKKATAKKVKSEEEVSSDSESESDDEPLVKKTKKPPTDDELRELIKKILDGADLEEITMKSVCKKVYAKYPEFDLVPRKSFIKATVKDIIN